MVDIDWREVTLRVRQLDPNTFGLVNSCKIKDVDGSVITMHFASDVLRNQMSKSQNSDILKTVLQEMYQADFEIVCVVKDKQDDIKPPPNAFPPEWDITAAVLPSAAQPTGDVVPKKPKSSTKKAIYQPSRTIWNTSFDGSSELFHCPICDSEYVHFAKARHKDSEDSYKAHSNVRGDVIEIDFWCEEGHEWILFIGFHKGYTLTWIETNKSLTYQEYIRSDEWRVKANQAKERAGWKCQLCNTSHEVKPLHAHHRTYERLYDERPEDITVLCKDCHKKFHDIVE